MGPSEAFFVFFSFLVLALAGSTKPNYHTEGKLLGIFSFIWIILDHNWLCRAINYAASALMRTQTFHLIEFTLTWIRRRRAPTLSLNSTRFSKHVYNSGVAQIANSWLMLDQPKFLLFLPSISSRHFPPKD